MMQANPERICGRQMRTGILFILTLFLLMVMSPAWGQTDSKHVSLDFVEADIHDVLKALSIQSGINVVAGNDVKGNVTLTLRNVTLDEALQDVTKVMGLSYQKIGPTYIVASDQTLKTNFSIGNKITEVITVPGAKASLIASLAAKVAPDTFAQASDDKTLVVNGSKEDILKIKDLVSKLGDGQQGTETETTEIYRVRYVDPQSALDVLSKVVPQVKAYIGPDYRSIIASNNSSSGGSSSNGGSSSSGSSSSGSSSSSSSSSGSGSSNGDETKTDMLVLTGYPSEIALAKQTLVKIDKAPKQVMVEAKVLIIDRTKSNDLGVQWGWSSITQKETGSGDGLKFGKFTHDAVSAEATITASVKRGDSKIMAAPKVAAIANRPANIFIGDTVLYPTYTVASGGTPLVNVQSVNVGINLGFTANPSEDGYITLNIHPYVSTISGYLETSSGKFPQISTRETQTVVRVKDDEPILIGGLLRDDDIKTMSKIPLLGDLPLLGNFFRSNTKSKVENELMVYILPKILPQDQ